VAGGTDALLEANFSYNVAALKPEVEHSDGVLTVRHPDVKTGVGSLWDLDDYRNEWLVRLNDKVPTDLSIALGAGTVDLQLAGLSLTGLDIDVGAATGTVDLRGDWARDLDVTVKAGLGSVVLHLPRNVGVRVQVQAGLGNVNAPGLAKEGNVYTNDAYGVSGRTLRMDIEAGVGRLNLELEQAAAPAGPAAGPAVTDEVLAEFTAYVEGAMQRWQIPGAAIAVVQDGKTVYAEGFGVRELGQDDPVTPDSLFVLGSMTKSVSDMLVAALVDEGHLDWDDRAVEILPSFQLADPDATSRVTVRDLLSMRAGLREGDELWRGQGLSAEALIAAMAKGPMEGQPGEAFHYDNVGIAAGAYLAALAAGGEYGELFNAYASLMQEHVYDPIGMKGATVQALDVIKTHPQVVWPHLSNQKGQLLPAEVYLEGSVPSEGIIPAGGMAASANDVARYLITHLNEGLSPDGERVVSALNLAETWTPQISIPPDAILDRVYIPSSLSLPVDAQVDYGMGWFIGTYNGIRVYVDPGNERGFTNIMALLPESDTGIVIMTNGESLPCARPMTLVVMYRFVELLYGLDNQVDGMIDAVLEQFGIECSNATEALTGELQATLDGWREDNDIIGATLAVYTPKLGSFELASGLSDRDAGTPMTPGHRLGVGSVNKMWVATLVLQLVDEGALTLDDPLSRWFPDFPNADQITVRQMLSHTSGATNYYARVEKFVGIFNERISTDWPGFTPDELIKEAAQLEPSFEPGEGVGYSNTNTVLLGRIVELVTGNPLHAELRSRVYEPLGLEDTFLAGAEEIPGGFGPGYTTEYAPFFGATEPTMALNERYATVLATLPWASGALVSTAPEVVRFERALFGGELLEEATLAEMLTPSPVIESFAANAGIDLSGGLGIWKYSFPNPIGPGMGHDGGIPGFTSVMLYFPEHEIWVAVLTNDDRADLGVFPRGKDLDTLVSDVLVVMLEHTTGREIQLDGEQAAGPENVYQDPGGRYSLPLIGDWTPVETDGTHAQFAYADMPLYMNVVTVGAGDLEASVDAALRQVGVDPAALTETNRGPWDKWSLFYYSLGDGQGVTVLAQAVEGTSYVIVATGDEALTANPPDDVLKTIQGFTVAGEEVAVPTTVSEFEAYVKGFVGM
jgi:CubicO group peptidase (beta-lactamase class C family)